MNKVKILFYSSPNYSGHAKALYNYINNNYKNKFNLYWVIDKDDDYLRLKNELNCLKYNSSTFNKEFKKMNVIFTTHGQLINETSDKQIYVNLWHGIGPKKTGYLLEEKNLAPQDKDFLFNLRRTTDYIICPSYFWQMVYSEKFKTSANRILPIGYPKLDEIVYSNGTENLNKILNIDVKKYNKIIFYTPTFKKGLGRKDENANKSNIFDLKEYNEYILLNYLINNNYLLLIKYHPSEETKFKRVEHNNVKYITESMLKKYNFNVNNILNGTDILITDYSSLGVEYTILDKPVIYLDNNIDEYKKNRGIVFDSGKFWMEKKASDIEELIKVISACKKKEISNNKAYYYGDLKDGGCANIVNYFFDKSFKLRKTITPYNDEYDELINEYNKLKQANEKNELIIKDLQTELNLILNSKSWKILEKIRKKLRK